MSEGHTAPGRVSKCVAAIALFAAGVACCWATSRTFSPASEPATRDIAEALGWMQNAPKNITTFDYVMTARVRLLLFWTGKDDVGGGYIRRGYSPDQPRQESIQVLFGSDPAKAPRAINRWGAGTEIVWHKDPRQPESAADDVVSSAFFGFMKSSKGKSASEMQDELKREKDKGEHLFTGILSRVDSGHAVSLVVPLASNTDFTLHQYEEAEPLVLEKLKAPDRPVREASDLQGCGRASAFLATVSQLTEAALRGQKTPQTLCYVYDAQIHNLTLQHVARVPKLVVQVKNSKGGMLVDRTYEELVEAELVSSSPKSGKRSEFTITVGSQGELRGVPVQVRYQPNWWFQVLLNLKPESLHAAVHEPGGGM